MVFWPMLFGFLIVAVVAMFVTEIVKMGLKHAENIKRIEHGYPTLDGSKPMGDTEREADIVDLTERLQ